MFSATDILANIKLCIIYRVLKASTLTLNKPLFQNIQASLLIERLRQKPLQKKIEY